uniref:Putative GT4 n=1 Tax=Magnetococcus massalia (strain MO-1) TaxID=451514 RepID=A0A1S7LQM1_MAGMO|nr:Putative GT4 [Candidatus Magnetococcus massalia]
MKIHCCHLLYRFDIGGLESVLVELIQRLPRSHYRHSVIALTDHGAAAERLTHEDVTLHALNKRAGKDLAVWWRLYKLLRQLKPDVMHSCNLSALEGQGVAALAGVPLRIHAEHGRDSYDLDGSNAKYRLLRKLINPFIHHWVPVSHDLARWLTQSLAIAPNKVSPIINGVDLQRFNPGYGVEARRRLLAVTGWPRQSKLIVTVGRLWSVKDHSNLLQAAQLLQDPAARVIIVGDGPEQASLQQQIAQLELGGRVELLHGVEDVATLLPGADLFVLPSMAEGTPLTLLEAMAAGLPVVATGVGGVPDLVVVDETGLLVPPREAPALAAALNHYLEHPELLTSHGAAGRQRAEQHYGWPHVIAQYDQLFGGTEHG